MQPRLTHTSLPGDPVPQGTFMLPRLQCPTFPAVSQQRVAKGNTLSLCRLWGTLLPSLHLMPLPASWTASGGHSLSPGRPSSLGAPWGPLMSSLETSLPVVVLPRRGGPEGLLRVTRDKPVWIWRPSGRGFWRDAGPGGWPTARVPSWCPRAGTAEDSEGRHFVQAGCGNNRPKTEGRKVRKVRWRMWAQYQYSPVAECSRNRVGFLTQYWAPVAGCSSQECRQLLQGC